VPVFAHPIGAVSSGFVELSGATLDQPATVDIWDHTTGTRHPLSFGAPRDATVQAAAGDVVVWTKPCTEGSPAIGLQCGANVTNVVTDETKNYGDWSARTFSLAPDGHGAVFVPLSGDGAGAPQYLDFASETRVPLPAANAVGRIVWGTGGWIFYSSDDGRGLAAWRPGMTRPRILTGVAPVLDAAAAI
jgi:hypothetical protein